jgi:hypothetical protein
MVVTAVALALLLSPAAAPAAANPAFTAEDLRLYCGWLTEIQKDDTKDLSRDKQLAKVAKLAKVAPKVLKETLEKGEKAGSSCEVIRADQEKKARAALAATPLDKRIESFQLDMEDPSHVGAYVSWKGDQEKRLEEEASLIAWAVGSASPIVRTLSARAVDPKDGETALFEGKISSENMGKIEKERIDSFADARYVKLFDGVLWANPAAHKH